jgi:hypothetical protein
MNAPFIFGLPTSHFDLALLWDHPLSVQRRTTAEMRLKGKLLSSLAGAGVDGSGPPLDIDETCFKAA